MGPTAALVLEALLEPRRLAARVRQTEPLGAALAVLLLASVSEALATLLVVRSTTGGSSGVAFLLWNTLLNLAGLAVLLGVGVIFVPFTARVFLGGRGGIGPLFWLLSFSYAPWVLWAPVGLILQMIPGGSVLWFLGHLGFLAWILALQIRAVGAGLHLSVLRAAFALVMGYGLAAMLYLFTAGLGFLGMVNTLLLWAS